MNFKESAKIVELEKRITALEKDISTLYNLIKSNINQNSVELEQNLTQGQDNGANTQSRIHSQHNGETISPTDLRYTNIYTRQHSFSNRRDDVADSALRTLLISIDSPRTPNGASISDSAKGNLTEPRNAAASRRGGAQSRESGAEVANQQEISRRGGAEAERSERISAISVCKTRLNDRELSTLKGYDEENQEQIIEKINNTISKIDKDIQYYEKKKSVFTSEAKERIPKQIMSDIAGLQTELNKYSTYTNIIKNTTNSKAFENVNKFYHTQKTQQRQR